MIENSNPTYFFLSDCDLGVKILALQKIRMKERALLMINAMVNGREKLCGLIYMFVRFDLLVPLNSKNSICQHSGVSSVFF